MDNLTRRITFSDIHTESIELSLVVPVYNEEEVLPYLYKRIITTLKNLDVSYELIFVDDSSTDKSLLLLKKFHQLNPRVKILSFSRNFGHQIAITAGFNFSRGKAVMVIDADLQDPPEIIPGFIQKWKEGYEVVYGIRKGRKEGFLLRSLYWIYYRLLKKMSKVAIPVDSGDCALLDRKVVDLLNRMPERNRFIRGLRSWVGFKHTGIEYERGKRFAGRPKYSFSKLLKLGIDGIISFSDVPLRVSIFIGFIISFISIIYSFYIITYVLFHPEARIPGWATIVVAITFLSGIQLMVMGFLGEYILRIFDEIKGRPLYILRETIGFNKNAPSLSNNPCL